MGLDGCISLFSGKTQVFIMWKLKLPGQRNTNNITSQQCKNTKEIVTIIKYVLLFHIGNHTQIQKPHILKLLYHTDRRICLRHNHWFTHNPCRSHQFRLNNHLLILPLYPCQWYPQIFCNYIHYTCRYLNIPNKNFTYKFS